MYEFLKSMNLLKSAPQLPKCDNYNVIYLGYFETEIINQYLPQKLPEETLSALAFVTVPDLEFNAVDITDVIKYIKQLETEALNEDFYKINKKLADAIMFEAIWMLDYIISLPTAKSPFQFAFGGIPQLFALLHDDKTDDGLPVLFEFESPVEKDVFLSQSKYFLKKYINTRLTTLTNFKNTNCFSEDFNTIFSEQISRYLKEAPCTTWHTALLTGIENPEMDLFIQQIAKFTYYV